MYGLCYHSFDISQTGIQPHCMSWGTWCCSLDWSEAIVQKRRREEDQTSDKRIICYWRVQSWNWGVDESGWYHHVQKNDDEGCNSLLSKLLSLLLKLDKIIVHINHEVVFPVMQIVSRAKELEVEVNKKFASKPYTGPPLWLKYEAAVALKVLTKMLYSTVFLASRRQHHLA